MFSNPDKNLAQLELKEGDSVADFGAGTGKYTISASRRVGHTGCVYSIEVQRDLVLRLENEIKKANIFNTDIVWGNIEKLNGTKIKSNSMDAVIISNVLFQAEDKIGLIEEAKRVLKKGGKVLFIEWSDSFNSMGPIKSHVITEDVAIDLFTKRGFSVYKNIDKSNHHYGIIFKYE